MQSAGAGGRAVQRVPLESTCWQRMLQGSVRDIRRLSFSWAPRVICRDGSCCRDCSISSVPASSRPAGSSASRWTSSTLDGLRKIAREALDQFSSRKVNEADWAAFSATLDYVPMSAGPGALKAAVDAEGEGRTQARGSWPICVGAVQHVACDCDAESGPFRASQRTSLLLTRRHRLLGHVVRVIGHVIVCGRHGPCGIRRADHRRSTGLRAASTALERAGCRGRAAGSCAGPRLAPGRRTQCEPASAAARPDRKPSRCPIPESGLRATRDARSEPPAAASAAPRELFESSGPARPDAPISGPIFATPPVTSTGWHRSGPAMAASRPAEPAPSVARRASGRHRLRRPVGEPDRGHARGARSASPSASPSRGVRQIELRGFAIGGGIDSRKVALARALVVRAYLIDCRDQGAHRGRQLRRRRQPRRDPGPGDVSRARMADAERWPDCAAAAAKMTAVTARRGNSRLPR